MQKRVKMAGLRRKSEEKSNFLPAREKIVTFLSPTPPNAVVTILSE